MVLALFHPLNRFPRDCSQRPYRIHIFGYTNRLDENLDLGFQENDFVHEASTPAQCPVEFMVERPFEKTGRLAQDWLA